VLPPRLGGLTALDGAGLTGAVVTVGLGAVLVTFFVALFLWWWVAA
jgi:hypothetical protein